MKCMCTPLYHMKLCENSPAIMLPTESRKMCNICCHYLQAYSDRQLLELPIFSSHFARTHPKVVHGSFLSLQDEFHTWQVEDEQHFCVGCPAQEESSGTAALHCGHTFVGGILTANRQ